eukprot:366071-Chlamydomonas_euryale.AAC.5
MSTYTTAAAATPAAKPANRAVVAGDSPESSADISRLPGCVSGGCAAGAARAAQARADPAAISRSWQPWSGDRPRSRRSDRGSPLPPQKSSSAALDGEDERGVGRDQARADDQAATTRARRGNAPQAAAAERREGVRGAACARLSDESGGRAASVVVERRKGTPLKTRSEGTDEPSSDRRRRLAGWWRAGGCTPWRGETAAGAIGVRRGARCSERSPLSEDAIEGGGGIIAKYCSAPRSPHHEGAGEKGRRERRLGGERGIGTRSRANSRPHKPPGAPTGRDVRGPLTAARPPPRPTRRRPSRKAAERQARYDAAQRFERTPGADGVTPQLRRPLANRPAQSAPLTTPTTPGRTLPRGCGRHPLPDPPPRPRALGPAQPGGTPSGLIAKRWRRHGGGAGAGGGGRGREAAFGGLRGRGIQTSVPNGH